ncbi:MAG: aminopeptidase [Lutisporaceae bacterium]
MKDPRIDLVAKNLIQHSVKLQKGEKVLINGSDESVPLLKALIKEAYNVGGIPFINHNESELTKTLLMNTCEEQLKLMAESDLVIMKAVDAYIGIASPRNNTNLGGIPGERMNLYKQQYIVPVHMLERVENTKWVIATFPNPAMAQSANMSTDAYEDFYYNVCCLDYSKLSVAMDPLVRLMERTDKVRLTGKDTDLTFSIKDLPAIKCDGHLNIPDGEVFTAPVKDTVNGYITYNTPTLYLGTTYENIRLEFQDGKIIKATSNNNEELNKVFDIDEGARYIGEFALGVNPYIISPMKNTLFDEKISGSFHFTPGNSYKEAFNGNKSAVHWDLVFIQRPEYGGGEIYFDDVLIRKDGLFVVDELKALNPENF